MASTPSKSRAFSSHHEVMTLPEAAAFLRVSEETLSKLAAEQVVPARKLGEEWRFLKSALEDWLRQDLFTAGKWLDAAPRWLELLPRELLLAELERRLAHGATSAEKRPAEPGSRERILELAGSWKDDPTLDEMLAEIYKQRGRPMTEE